MKNLTKLFLKLSLAIVFCGGLTIGANAQIVVDRTDDDLIGGVPCQSAVANDCTLRTAISLINSPVPPSTQIQFAGAIFGNGGTITLNNELVISKNAEITQTSLTAPVTIDADDGSRVFTVGAGITVTMTRLRLINGNAGGGNGGGILNNGNLTVRESTVGGNAAADGNTSSQGGGIFNNGGTLNLARSTVSFNSAGSGGGIYNSNGADGGTGSVSLENSTISNNSAGGGFGGGYFGFSQVGTTNLSAANATFAENVAGNGGGIAVASTVTVPPLVSSSTVSLNNTLIGNNSAVTAGSDVYTNPAIIPLPIPNTLPGSITSSGYNFIENTSGANILPMTGDQFDLGDPKLLPLNTNGGLTRTHALRTTGGDLSLAIDAGNSNLLTDQRGFGRPVDYPNGEPTRVLAANTDIGAFEAQLIPTAASATISGRFLSPKGRGIYGVRVTLTAADGTSRTVLTNPFGYYRFADVAIGQSVIILGDAKLYQFPARTVSVTEDLTGIDFIF